MNMADFSGDIEDDVRTAQSVRKRGRVGNVFLDHLNVRRSQVVPVGATSRDKGVDYGNPRTLVRQADGQVATDEAKAAGYKCVAFVEGRRDLLFLTHGTVRMQVLRHVQCDAPFSVTLVSTAAALQSLLGKSCCLRA
jgi:hypothetical protein